MNDLRALVWIDPGGTTGIASWMPPKDPMKPISQQSWRTVQIGPCDQDMSLVAILAELNNIVRQCEPFHNDQPFLTVGFESFDFRMEERYRDRIDYTAAEVIGALRCWGLDRKAVHLVRTGAGLGKGFWTDERIKALGLWVPNYRHAMDAMRHLLRYRSFVLNHTELFEPFRPARGTLPWDNPDHDVVADLREAKRKGREAGFGALPDQDDLLRQQGFIVPD